MSTARKTDLILTATVGVLALVFFLLNRGLIAEKGVYAEIYHGFVLVDRIELSNTKGGIFSIPGASNVVFQHYADGSIAFIESDCPDKVCIRSGRLKNAGQFAACLPNRILLKIVSEEKEGEGPDLILQ